MIHGLQRMVPSGASTALQPKIFNCSVYRSEGDNMKIVSIGDEKTDFTSVIAALPDGNGGFVLCPELMTEDEVIRFLRIPEVSNSGNYHNVIENLKRMHGLPRIHICGKPLYPRQAISDWIKEKTTNSK